MDDSIIDWEAFSRFKTQSKTARDRFEREKSGKPVEENSGKIEDVVGLRDIFPSLTRLQVRHYRQELGVLCHALLVVQSSFTRAKSDQVKQELDAINERIESLISDIHNFRDALGRGVKSLKKGQRPKALLDKRIQEEIIYPIVGTLEKAYGFKTFSTLKDVMIDAYPGSNLKYAYESYVASSGVSQEIWDMNQITKMLIILAEGLDMPQSKQLYR